MDPGLIRRGPDQIGLVRQAACRVAPITAGGNNAKVLTEPGEPTQVDPTQVDPTQVDPGG